MLISGELEVRRTTSTPNCFLKYPNLKKKKAYTQKLKLSCQPTTKLLFMEGFSFKLQQLQQAVCVQIFQGSSFIWLHRLEMLHHAAWPKLSEKQDNSSVSPR